METVKVVPQITRERLLEAAGEVFAEQGYRKATVRDICERAGANIAAVNYHYGDKERLYSAVLTYAHGQAMAKFPPTLGLGKDPEPEQRLAAFVRSFLFRTVEDGRVAWFGKLIAREMAEPTAALDDLVRESVRPHFELLASIVADLLGPPAPSPELVQMAACSVVGQCLFYFHARAVIERLTPEQSFDSDAIERLAQHITHFSLTALTGLRREMAAPEEAA